MYKINLTTFLKVNFAIIGFTIKYIIEYDSFI